MMTRRTLLASFAAASSVPNLGWAGVGNPAFLAAAKQPDGSFALYGLDTEGEEVFQVPMPARGHCGCAHPTRAEAVAFARRPGYFAQVLDVVAGRVIHELTPSEGRAFNGHGSYIDGGATLLTVEQETEGSDGRIGIWDVASGYTRIGEIATHGIGPHDIKIMPDGQTLVVANGGIQTGADGRTKLNTDSMAPSLVYLSLAGEVLEEVRLDPALSQNSIRHLALREDGLVGFAMQWQGEAGLGLPLLGMHRRGEKAVLAQAPLAEELAMKGYAGSIAFSAEGGEIAITSPKGGRLNRFTPEGDFIAARLRADVCGLASHPEGLVASDGYGGLIVISGDEARPLARHDCAWDNHIVTL